MKMVAAAKLKKAQENAQARQPYAQAMAEVMVRVAATVGAEGQGPKLLSGTGKDDVHLLVVVTSDRGLCGGFNGNLVRKLRLDITALKDAGKTVKLVCAGRKGYDVLKREFSEDILHKFIGLGGKEKLAFADAEQVSRFVLDHFNEGKFDVCTLYYNSFISVLTQKPTPQQLIPFKAPETEDIKAEQQEVKAGTSFYDFEPDEKDILDLLLPKNLGVQIFRALLDSAAGEQAARMTAMDNATRNAGEMIDKLTLQYNRARQAAITRELIEIISGAEAL